MQNVKVELGAKVTVSCTRSKVKDTAIGTPKTHYFFRYLGFRCASVNASDKQGGYNSVGFTIT